MMKKWMAVFLALMVGGALLLSGCKSTRTVKETTASAQSAATEAESGYDETSPKSADWFDNAVFVGDSVTLKLSNYCFEHPEALGDAAFFCAGSLGYTNALWELDDPEAVHPYYEGTVYRAEDCVGVTGRNNVFIMLGMNDIGLYGTQAALESCRTLVANILTKSPQAHIYIQSVTPMIQSAEMESFNNTLIKEFDALLKSYCEENGYKYLDVFSALADTNGNLPDEYCSDPEAMGLHFSDTACEMWATYLKNNA